MHRHLYADYSPSGSILKVCSRFLATQYNDFIGGVQGENHLSSAHVCRTSGKWVYITTVPDGAHRRAPPLSSLALCSRKGKSLSCEIHSRNFRRQYCLMLQSCYCYTLVPHASRTSPHTCIFQDSTQLENSICTVHALRTHKCLTKCLCEQHFPFIVDQWVAPCDAWADG
jgi:hypothetical protein